MARITTSMVTPELRRPLRLLPPLRVQTAWFRHLEHFLLDRMPAAIEDGVTLEQPADAVPGTRLYRPPTQTSDAALLWIHGGGLVIGNPVQDDKLCSSTAKELGLPVLSAKYRLAPQHPYPAALEDCQAAWRWLQEHAPALGVDPDRVVIGGQSAGGGLAASLVQRLHDEGGAKPMAQWLFSPMIDDRTAARRELDDVRHKIWNNKANHFGWRSYLGAEPGSAGVPAQAAAARREGLAGLPPTWIGVGDIDLFHDEDEAFAERLRAAGVEVSFHVVAGAPHGFESWGSKTSVAREFVGVAQGWLRSAIGN